MTYGDDKYVLDLGWYGTEYAILIIESLDWSNSLWERRSKQLSDLFQLMSEAATYIRKILNYSNE